MLKKKTFREFKFPREKRLSHLIEAFSARDSYLDHLAVKRIINNRAGEKGAAQNVSSRKKSLIKPRNLVSRFASPGPRQNVPSDINLS